MGGKSLVPRGSGEGGIGKSNVWWGTGYFNNIYCDTGYFGNELLLSGRDVMEIIDTTVEEKIEEVGGGPRWERAETEGNIYFPNNVGINNVNPSEKLDISGSVLISNNLTVSNLLSGRSIDTQSLSISGTGFNIIAKDLSLDVLKAGTNVFIEKDELRRTAKIHTLHEPIDEAAESTSNAGRTYVQNIELDEYGHITGITTETETGIDTQRTDDEIKDIGTGLIEEGANITIDKNATNKTLTLNSHHPVVPRSLENSNNEGRDYIQNIKFDNYGHVTGLEIGTETITSENVLSKVKAGENVRVLDNNSGGIDIHSDHPATENVAGSTHNFFENRTYIKDIKLDQFGHITGIAAGQETITPSDLSDYVTSNLTEGDNINLNRHRELLNHDSSFAFSNLDSNSNFVYVGEGTAWQDPINGFFVDFGDGQGHNTFVSDGESGLSINYESASVAISANSPLVDGDVPPLSLSGQYTSYVETERVSISSSHIIVSNVPPSSNNQNRTYIQNIDLDEFGHVNGLSVGTESFVSRTDSEIYEVVSNILSEGSNITLTKNSSTEKINISSDHITISAAQTTNNTGRQYIKNITFDIYGHAESTESGSERTDSQIINIVGAALVPGENISIETDTPDKIKINYDLASEILESAYPVGSIYISVNSTSPESTFGGSWERFAEGRCLIGLDSTDSDFNNISETGGFKTHTLTVNEMPAHNHGATPEFDNASSRGTLSSNFSLDGSNIINTGGGAAHNNMQPYIVVAMWKRTA